MAGEVEGMRFFPTDVEIIRYLRKRSEGTPLPPGLIHEFDVYSQEPWNLPRDFMRGIGEEVYYVTPRHKATANGCRANRNAGQGFWHGQGRDQLIFDYESSEPIGHKTFLVFKFRDNEKKRLHTNWIMHEYLLHSPHRKGVVDFANLLAMDDKKPYITIIVIQAIYAGMTMLSKAAFNGGMNTAVFVCYRQAIGTAALVPFAVAFGRSAPSLSFVILVKIFLLALLGTTFCLNVLSVAINYTSATVASAATNTIPVMTFLLALVFRMETIKLKSISGIAKIFGVAVCLAGVLVIAFYEGPSLKSLKHQQLSLLGTNTIDNYTNSKTKWVLGTFLMVLFTTCWSLWIVLQFQEMALCRIHPKEENKEAKNDYLAAHDCKRRRIHVARSTLLDDQAYEVGDGGSGEDIAKVTATQIEQHIASQLVPPPGCIEELMSSDSITPANVLVWIESFLAADDGIEAQPSSFATEGGSGIEDVARLIAIEQEFAALLVPPPGPIDDRSTSTTISSTFGDDCFIDSDTLKWADSLISMPPSSSISIFSSSQHIEEHMLSESGTPSVANILGWIESMLAADDGIDMQPSSFAIGS